MINTVPVIDIAELDDPHLIAFDRGGQRKRAT